ncbi:hypothetical protein Srufu_048040 [Streptomyces libani subsp. rufus]|nr:hypothetical protein Srufu_048040 [Streptomyces libani subsp. rufus]
MRSALGGQLVGGDGGALDGAGDRVVLGAQYGGEHLAQGVLFGAGAQDVDVRLEVVDAQALQEVRGLCRVPEAAQTVEEGERDDQLGLVVCVLVVAVAGVDGDAAPLLVGEAFGGLRPVGVDLEGERGAGREQLEQEGQPGPKARTASAPSSASGAASITSARETGPAPRSIREGAPGWAPSHISAWGSPVGAVPRSSGRAVVEPQA